MRFMLKEGYGKHHHGRGKDRKLYSHDEGGCKIITVKSKRELGNTLDKWIQIDGEVESEGVIEGETLKKFAVKRRKAGKGEKVTYDVVNLATSKTINDKGMTNAEALELAGDMEREADEGEEVIEVDDEEE